MTNKKHISEFFNTKEAAALLGVNVSTIKRWTDTGLLRCHKTDGGHRRFRMRHLAEFYNHQSHRDLTASPILPLQTKFGDMNRAILRKNYSRLRKILLNHAVRGNLPEVSLILKGLFLSGEFLHAIYDDLLVPVLHKIGDEWQAGKLMIIDEHIASQTIRESISRLQGIVTVPPASNKIAVCMSMPDELHDIPLKMVSHLLEIKAIHVLFGGQLTPFADMQHLLNRYSVQYLFISSTMGIRKELHYKQLMALIQMAQQKNIEVIVGGQGFSAIELPEEPSIVHLSSFSQLASMNL